MSNTTKLFLIYNADGSFKGEIDYIVAKIFRGKSCSACDITHSFAELGMKKDFKKLCQRRNDWEIITLHKDELAKVQGLSQFSIHPPCVVQQTQDGFQTICSNKELSECKSSVTAFEKLLESKIAG
jgi:hypothetical protein